MLEHKGVLWVFLNKGHNSSNIFLYSFKSKLTNLLIISNDLTPSSYDYSKLCLKRTLKNRQNKDHNNNW